MRHNAKISARISNWRQVKGKSVGLLQLHCNLSRNRPRVKSKIACGLTYFKNES